MKQITTASYINGQESLDPFKQKISRDLVKVLADFIKRETLRFGIKKLVIGLSGGIDSTVSAYLAAKSVKPENVFGLIMPYAESDPVSLKHALKVVNILNIKSKIINLTPCVKALSENDPSLLRDRIRKGNILARLRMLLLFDYSNKYNALVLGTGNKTEILLGYTTLYGDSASAINPLGDLYKTQVWQLAELLKCPREIIKKKPSADLWRGQSDEGELGFTYKDVDRLLYYMVDQKYGDDELIAIGFKRSFISKIRKIIRRNQYKRVPPVIAKISNRTVNVDFRYNRDWGT